jgi:hypothetical protein
VVQQGRQEAHGVPQVAEVALILQGTGLREYRQRRRPVQ